MTMAASEPYSLRGKTAVVTGAGDGIGRAIVLAFARAGAQVACIDVDADAAAATREEAAKTGIRAIAISCDVSKENQVADAAKDVLEAFGTVHILVNGAAGDDPNGTVLELSLSDWNRVFAVNVGGAFLMSRAFLPAIVAAGGGSIIHIASQLGSVAGPRRAVYCASKGALIQLAKAMATDLRRRMCGSIRSRPAPSKRNGWCAGSGTWTRPAASPVRSICCSVLVSRTKSRPLRFFWRATRQAS